MKYVLSILTIALFLGQTKAQTIINGDFESWDETVPYESTSAWDNSNLEFGNEGLTLDVTDVGAFEGNHAVYLETKEINDEAYFGFVLNGVFGDEGPESGFPYEGTIDGLSVNLQYDVEVGDSANVILVGFYEGEIADMTVVRLTGTQPSWVELNVEFTGATLVDEVLVAFASSNAMSDTEEPIDGSWLMVDNVQLTLNDNDIDVIPNGGFEDFEMITTEFPVAWSTNGDYGDDLVVKTDFAYDGDYAIQVKTIYDSETEEVSQGYITNGVFDNNGPSGGQAIDSRPNSFIGYYYFDAGLSAEGNIYAQFMLNGESVGSAVVSITPDVDVSGYTQFNVPVQFSDMSVPDAVIITATAGEEEGSFLYLDNLSFNFAVGIEEGLSLENIDFKTFPNPYTDVLNFTLEAENAIVEAMSIYDVTGKMILDFDPSFLTADNEIVSIDLSTMNSGTYLLVLRTNLGVITETVIKK